MASLGGAASRPSAVMRVSSSAAWLRGAASPVFDLTPLGDSCRCLATVRSLGLEWSGPAYNRLLPLAPPRQRRLRRAACNDTLPAASRVGSKARKGPLRVP